MCLVCTLLGLFINQNSILFRLKERLRDMIDPDFGLPALLMEKDILTDIERRNVGAKGSLQERNDVLLNFMLHKKEAAEWLFIDALLETDQEHVWNFIDCEGGKQFAV